MSDRTPYRHMGIISAFGKVSSAYAAECRRWQAVAEEVQQCNTLRSCGDLADARRRLA